MASRGLPTQGDAAGAAALIADKTRVIAQPGDYVTALNSNDVLCGRGSGPNDHAGNIRFRELVAQRKQEYLSTNTRQTKGKIAREIVDQVQILSDPPGRFLKKLESSAMKAAGFPRGTEVWCVVDEDTALEKAKQALRQNRGERGSGAVSDGGGSRPTSPVLPNQISVSPNHCPTPPTLVGNYQTDPVHYHTSGPGVSLGDASAMAQPPTQPRMPPNIMKESLKILDLGSSIQHIDSNQQGDDIYGYYDPNVQQYQPEDTADQGRLYVHDHALSQAQTRAAQQQFHTNPNVAPGFFVPPEQVSSIFSPDEGTPSLRLGENTVNYSKEQLNNNPFLEQASLGSSLRPSAAVRRESSKLSSKRNPKLGSSLSNSILSNMSMSMSELSFDMGSSRRMSVSKGTPKKIEESASDSITDEKSRQTQTVQRSSGLTVDTDPRPIEVIEKAPDELSCLGQSSLSVLKTAIDSNDSILSGSGSRMSVMSALMSGSEGEISSEKS